LPVVSFHPGDLPRSSRDCSSTIPDRPPRQPPFQAVHWRMGFVPPAEDVIVLHFLLENERGLNRRDWLRLGGCGLAGLALPSSGRARSRLAIPGFGKARSVLLVFTSGGMSQIDT